MKHLLSIADLSREDAQFLLAEAVRLKNELRENPQRQRETLGGKTLAMVFEKPSLRTRVSFDVGMHQLGGHAIYLSPAEVGLGKRESVGDVARVLGRMCDGIMARVFRHETVAELSRESGVPVVNGLSDAEHPCQALADLLTLHEHRGLPGRVLAYVGDGNNVAHSLMLLCAKLGVEFRGAFPEGYEPASEVVQMARLDGEAKTFRDPREAVENADAVYTDVWTSMGQEAENEERLKVFPPYQLNAELLRGAKSDAIVMHDLPAHRGEEITNEVMDGAQSVIFDEAENRLHAQKAVLSWLLSQDRSDENSAETSRVAPTTNVRLSSTPLPQN